MEDTLALFIPIAICVILPIAIVWIVVRAFINRDNKRTEVLIEAIRSNSNIDADRLAEAMTKRAHTPHEVLNLRLLRGCIFSLAGVAFLGYNMYLSYKGGCGDDMLTSSMIAALIFLAIGISYIIVYFVSRRELNED